MRKGVLETCTLCSYDLMFDFVVCYKIWFNFVRSKILLKCFGNIFIGNSLLE